MAWAAGELERYLHFFEQRAQRIEHRAMVETAMLAPSGPFLAVQANFGALIWDYQQRQLPAEEEFEESEVDRQSEHLVVPFPRALIRRQRSWPSVSRQVSPSRS